MTIIHPMAPIIEWTTNLLSDNEENNVNEFLNGNYLAPFSLLLVRVRNLIKTSNTINNFGRCASPANFNLYLSFHGNMIYGRLYRKFQEPGMGG